jgi:phosphoglycerate dehydrogenase-like enzyme
MPMIHPINLNSTRSASDTTAIVFALSEFEMHRFFPEANFPGMRWIDGTACTLETWHQHLREKRPRVVVAGWSTPPLPADAIASRGGSVDYLCQVTGSVRHVVSRDMLNAGLLVSNWGTLVAPLVAEHALLLLLAGMRNMGAWHTYMLLPRERQRKSDLETRRLRGRRVALYGFGAIAQNLVGLLRPFNVDISAYSEGVPVALFEEFGVRQAPSLIDLCLGADALVCCEALTDSTRHSINATVLAGMPPGGVFVNVGRGAVADEQALVEASRSRGLRIASDVFASEPLPQDSPLFHLPGAILSPHIAGPTHDYFEECGRYALANISRYLGGETPLSLIDTTIYDRST